MNRNKPMNRGTGFAPKHPPKPPREWEGPAPVQAPVRATLGRPDGKARMTVAAPKREYVRNEALREAYRKLPCQFDGCGAQDGTVCCAHSNWACHGKSLAMKADDSRGAAACYRHHTMLDQGSVWTEAQRKENWWRAHVKSVRLLLERGLWPLSVPVPDIENNPWEDA